MQTLTPEPGLYQDIPDADYRAWDAVSYSLLKEFDRSPLHVKAILEGRREPTKAMKFGTLVHTALLQPKVFKDRYVVMPDFAEGLVDDFGEPYASPKATKKYKTRKAKFQAEHAGKILVEPKEYEACEGILNSILSDPSASHLFENITMFEASATWVDERSGLRFKSRFDSVTERFGAVLDIKKVADARPSKFQRDIEKYLYYLQGAKYLRGARAVGLDVEVFTVIACEEKYPHAASVINLTEEQLELGNYELDEFAAKYVECKKTGYWGGYSDIVMDGWMSDHKKRKLEEYRRRELDEKSAA